MSRKSERLFIYLLFFLSSSLSLSLLPLFNPQPPNPWPKINLQNHNTTTTASRSKQPQRCRWNLSQILKILYISKFGKISSSQILTIIYMKYARICCKLSCSNSCKMHTCKVAIWWKFQYWQESFHLNISCNKCLFDTLTRVYCCRSCYNLVCRKFLYILLGIMHRASRK